MNAMSQPKWTRKKYGKIEPEDMELIEAAVKERERLARELSQLSNPALARKFEVSTRTMTSMISRVGGRK